MNFADRARKYRRRNILKASYKIIGFSHYKEYQVKGKNCSKYDWFPSDIKATKKDIKKY